LHVREQGPGTWCTKKVLLDCLPLSLRYLPLLSLWHPCENRLNMPRSYPPYSTRRQNNRSSSTRSQSGSRDRQNRHSRNHRQNDSQERGGKWPRLRAHLVAMSGEFIGTVLFLWFAFAGTQVAAMSNPSGDVLQPQGLVYISLSFGMSLLVVAWAMYRISGGLFNPAVSATSPASSISNVNIIRSPAV
jgi:hypothetical protein